MKEELSIEEYPKDSSMGEEQVGDGEEKTKDYINSVPSASFKLLPIPERALSPYLSAGCYYGNGEVFYVDTAQLPSENQEENELYEDRSCLFAMAADGTGSPKMIIESIPDLSIGCFFIDQDQALYLYEYQSLYDPNSRKPVTTSYLRKIDAEGTEVYRTDLSEAMCNIFTGDMIQCYVDQEGNVALLDQTGDQVFFVDSDGKYFRRAETENMAISAHFNTNALVFAKDQGYYLWNADTMERKMKLWEVDFQNGLVSEEPVAIPMSSLVENPAETLSTSDYVLFDGDERGLLISTEDILWQYDLVTEELTERFRWDDGNVDLDGRLVSQIKWREDTPWNKDTLSMDLLIFESSTSGWYSNPMTVHIGYVDRSQVPERQTVVIGLDRYDGNIKNLVRRFNRLNGTYRARLEAYDSGELKEMLMYGGAGLPDLLEITGIRTEWLETKNLLEDLNPYLEKSGQISREEILPSVLELLEKDGKLLSMAVSFTMRTLITAADFMEEGRSQGKVHSMEESRSIGEGKAHFAEGNWDYDSFLSLGSLYPESRYFDTNSAGDLWGAISVTILDQFVDWKKRECSFDSAEFKRLIEKINNHGNSAKPAGANYAESPNKEGAWAFMEFLLSADEQSWYSSANNVFPVRRDSFEAYLTRAYSYLEEDLASSLDSAREDTPEKLRYMAEHLGMNQNESEISTIVAEELQAYFKGQKTADETAKIIQSRVQLYLDEMKK